MIPRDFWELRKKRKEWGRVAVTFSSDHTVSSRLGGKKKRKGEGERKRGTNCRFSDGRKEKKKRRKMKNIDEEKKKGKKKYKHLQFSSSEYPKKKGKREMISVEYPPLPPKKFQAIMKNEGEKKKNNAIIHIYTCSPQGTFYCVSPTHYPW